jgi:hypothetical protein
MSPELRKDSKPRWLFEQACYATRHARPGHRLGGAGLAPHTGFVFSVASRPPLFPSFFSFLDLVTINLYDSL